MQSGPLCVSIFHWHLYLISLFHVEYVALFFYLFIVTYIIPCISHFFLVINFRNFIFSNSSHAALNSLRILGKLAYVVGWQFPLGWRASSSVGSGSVAGLLARCLPLMFRQCFLLAASLVPILERWGLLGFRKGYR